MTITANWSPRLFLSLCAIRTSKNEPSVSENWFSVIFPPHSVHKRSNWPRSITLPRPFLRRDLQGDKSKWMCEGFRKSDVSPLRSHWGSELSTELLVRVKRNADVIEIDTAVLREKRGSSSPFSIIVHQQAHTHALPNEKFTVHNSLPGTEQKNPKQSFFFSFFF